MRFIIIRFFDIFKILIKLNFYFYKENKYICKNGNKYNVNVNYILSRKEKLFDV